MAELVPLTVYPFTLTVKSTRLVRMKKALGRKIVIQVTWNFKIGAVGRIYLFCSKFLFGDDKEIICLCRKIPQNPLKCLKKIRLVV